MKYEYRAWMEPYPPFNDSIETQLNRLGAEGWHLVGKAGVNVFVLERSVPEPKRPWWRRWR